jgi:Nif-specific regulatory protein
VTAATRAGDSGGREERPDAAGANAAPADRVHETLALFLEVSRSFHELSPVDRLLPLITDKLRALLDAEACSVILYDPDRDELYFPVSSDDRLGSAARLREIRFPASQGISGWVLREGRSVLVPDVASDPRFYHAVDRQTGTESRSLICAPLRTRTGVIGVTQVINKRGGPFTPEDLALLDAIAGSIAVALENARLHDALRRETETARSENVGLRRAVGEHFRGIVGASPALRRVLDEAAQAAPTRATVTILGETGTGKELVARAIHRASDRAGGPFIAVNCAAIPATLLESELFGHERGAFTGAVAARRGKFELAHGGTLFLDEIAELEPALQAKILRVLEHGEVQPLGSERSRHVDVRVVAATNRDLRAQVEAGQFRDDLYWRINVITLELPPLRERREDLPLLVRHFLERLGAELGRGPLGLHPEAEAALVGYDYPGNVRELENVLRRAATLAPGPEIGLKDLPPHVATRAAVAAGSTPATNAALKSAKAAAAAAAADVVEQRFLTEALRAARGNVSEAARRAGMNRTWLHQLLAKHRLDPKRFVAPGA